VIAHGAVTSRTEIQPRTGVAPKSGARRGEPPRAK